MAQMKLSVPVSYTHLDVYKRQELDSITGRIAQKLYPQAEIKVAGFETTDGSRILPFSNPILSNAS